MASLLHQRLCHSLLPSMFRYRAMEHALDAGELQGAALTRLALQTLGSFDFGSMRLLDFVRDHVTLFLDDPDVSVRRAAAAASAKVLHRAASIPPGSHGSISQNQVHSMSLLHEVPWPLAVIITLASGLSAIRVNHRQVSPQALPCLTRVCQCDIGQVSLVCLYMCMHIVLNKCDQHFNGMPCSCTSEWWKLWWAAC